MSFAAVIAWIQSKCRFVKTRPWCPFSTQLLNCVIQRMEVNQFMGVATKWLGNLGLVQLVSLPGLWKLTLGLGWRVVFFLLSGSISMASSDDAEDTLTPVDFIQLQHYMACKSRLLGCNYYYYCSFLSMENTSLFITLWKWTEWTCL